MKLILDNIIFSLQRAGGISIVWKEHLKRLSECDCTFIEYDNAEQNIFRKELDIPASEIKLLSSSNLQIKRYLNPRIPHSDDVLFHSSYYRTLKDARNITTVHDFTYEYYVHGIKQKVHSRQKKQAVLHSDKIICVSQNTRDDLLKFYPMVNPDKIAVVYNGVDEVFCKLPMVQNIEGIPYEVGEYLLFVGDRFAPYKQFSLAVEVAKQVKKPLVIVGKPLTAIEEQMLIPLEYKVLSRIPSPVLNLLYNNAFCLLYPSLYEGFGIPVIEAQKAGCPVIAGANSSIVEVIGKGGIAFGKLDTNSVVDAVLALDKGDYRNEIIQYGIENAKRFSWDKTYKETMNIYKSLM